jgi:hypothetical protein
LRLVGFDPSAPFDDQFCCDAHAFLRDGLSGRWIDLVRIYASNALFLLTWFKGSIDFESATRALEARKATLASVLAKAGPVPRTIHRGLSTAALYSSASGLH